MFSSRSSINQHPSLSKSVGCRETTNLTVLRLNKYKIYHVCIAGEISIRHLIYTPRPNLLTKTLSRHGNKVINNFSALGFFVKHSPASCNKLAADTTVGEKHNDRTVLPPIPPLYQRSGRNKSAADTTVGEKHNDIIPVLPPIPSLYPSSPHPSLPKSSFSS